MLKLTEYVQVKTAPEEAEDEQPGLDRRAPFFPNFVWAVRDFTLQLEVDGKEISEDEYLENALKLKDGRGAVLCCWTHPAPDTAAVEDTASLSPGGFFWPFSPHREQPGGPELQPAAGMHPPALPGAQVLRFRPASQEEGPAPLGGAPGRGARP